MAFIGEMFGGDKPKVETEPVPDRNTAADALADQEQKDNLRRAQLAGRQSTNFTGATGGNVSGEMTGLRQLAGV